MTTWEREIESQRKKEPQIPRLIVSIEYKITWFLYDPKDYIVILKTK